MKVKKRNAASKKLRPLTTWELIKEHPELDYTGSEQFNNQFVRWIVKRDFFRPPGNLLDMGCGRGYAVNMFNRLGFKCKACDLEPLEKWIDKVDLGKDRLPYPDNYFDFIFSKNVIEFITNPSHTMSEAYRVLKPGGRILMITPGFTENMSVIPNVYTNKKLRGIMLRHHFKIIKVRTYRQIPGIWRYFLWAFDVHIPGLEPRFLAILGKKPYKD